VVVSRGHPGIKCTGHIFLTSDFPQLQLFMVKHKSVVGCLESRHVHARALSHKSVAAASTKKSRLSLCAAVLSSLLVLRAAAANFANEDLGLVGGRLLTRWPRTSRRLEEMGWKASAFYCATTTTRICPT
jgi:hypothetical protein